MEVTLDNITSKVTSVSSVAEEAIQRSSDTEEELATENPTSSAEIESPSTETIQRKTNNNHLPKTPINLSPTSGGNPLPPAIQKKMERAFSTNFNNVRIHTGSQAKLIKAQAYTQGNNIHFAPGKYNPETESGQALIGHELTHVVQQKAGKVSVPQGKNLPINADSALEAEADELGLKAAKGEQVTVAGTSANLQESAPTTAPIQ